MSIRLRRLTADYEKVRTELIGHKYIKVEPIEGDPPEKYLVSYNVKGLKLDSATNRPVETDFHQVVVYLPLGYPREKPVCKITTDIFHPNFRGSQVCIGDEWAAGGSLADVIIHIGEMIQYRNYNPKSPLDPVAAKWATQNEHLFPIGNIDLYQPDVSIEIPKDEEGDIDIELFGNDEVDEIEIELL